MYNVVSYERKNTMQTPEQWAINEKMAKWTCIPGDMEPEYSSDEGYYSDEPDTDDNQWASKQTCGPCGWQFLADGYFGGNWGDVCPNCGTPFHDFYDYPKS